ncbi:MAG: amino acid dehydrogenase [Bacteroidetes bacterium]|jgi:glutamate dehydrogenase/leucine dehydrogenase|nr:amino acid dehydrogenase [Bacteroidota bacterium]
MTLKEYINTAPQIVFEWNDSETSARGWVVINSLKNGAAGGGTRMRSGLTKSEVVSLAKVMEVKFTVSGPDIGGAKSGIDFDPSDPRREEVLGRWYKAIFPLLKNYYGTGGDLNVDELKDVIPITEDLGLWHPQEGIVNGHLESGKGDKVRKLGQLRFGVAKVIEDKNYAPINDKKYAVADMITGWGVAQAVKHYYDIFSDGNVSGKRAIIQGWGNVASAAAYYLANNGVKIVSIIDRNGGIIKESGFSAEEIEDLFINKDGNQLHSPHSEPFDIINEKIWDVPTDIFIPGAASKIIARNQMERLIAAGLDVMSCGANVPFVDDEIFFGPTAKWVDDEISLIPDFIANCGMARTFAFLMEKDIDITDENIFTDVSNTIKTALREIHSSDTNSKVSLFQKAIEISLRKTNG